MKVLINGAGFANKGAEAMLRTVQVELASRFTSVEFVLWRCPEWNHPIATASGTKTVRLPFELPSSKWRLFGGQRGRRLWSVWEIVNEMKMKQISLLFDRDKRFSKACHCFLRRAIGGFDFFMDISGFA